jgi:predicted MFS family arabinose efflux permease
LLPASLAAAGDYFAYQERGRVMAWAMTGTTVAPILGLPLGALLAGLFSWRVTFVLLALIAVALAIMIRALLPAQHSAQSSSVHADTASGGFRAVIGERPVIAALISDYLGFSYWYTITIFVGAFFHQVFGMPVWALGVVTMTYGFGMLVGGNIGGRLSDRLGKRRVIVTAGVACTVLATLLTTATGWAVISVAVLLLFAIHNGARVVSARALLTQMSPQARGTVMSVNAAGMQFATVTGSIVGGLAIDAAAYTYLGPAAALLALAATATFAAFVREPSAATREPAASRR